LQPFSPDYFEPNADPRRRSFNDEYCDALKQRLALPPTHTPAELRAGTADESGDESDDENEAREPQECFFALPLTRAGPEFREVTLDNLARFFRNPCRYLLRVRLGIVLPEGDEELEDDEPFVSNVPERSALARRVLPRLLGGEAAGSLLDFARAGIEYPAGRLGELELEQELQRLDHFARTLAPLLGAPTLDPVGTTLEFTIDGEPWRLTGNFGDLRRTGLVRFRYDDTRAGDYLAGWLEHLFLRAMELPEVAPRTTWHSRDGDYVLGPVDDARAQLATLLGLYREGLHRPLHFFPKSAWRYMTEGKRIAAAITAWRSTPFNNFAEVRDPAYRLALRGVDDPLDDEFVACATRVFQPLLDAVEDDRLPKASA
jgi:exodeoxyribonuclease V gamma subunit